MTATTARPAAASPRWAALSGSFVLHAGLLAGLAAIPAGLVAATPPAPAEADHPFAVTWVRAPAETEAVVVAEAPPMSRVRAARPEVVEFLEFTVTEPPPVIDATARDPAAPPSTLAPASWSRLQELACLRPGHGAGNAGSGRTSAGGASGSGAGGHGPGGGLATGAAAGTGTDEGGEGDGSGWVSRGGETRGPAVVGVLPPPAYPASARRHGWEGRVVLDLAIDERGRVVGADVAESSGRPALDEAARDAATSWTFAAALRDGAPVAGTLRVPVRFELTD